MSDVRIFRPMEVLPASIGASIVGLDNRVWPPASGDYEGNLSRAQTEWNERRGIHCVVMGDKKPSEVVAYSYIFLRDVFTREGVLGIGALAGVCVDPAYRGRGLGADVAMAAFAVMSELGVEVSLFQTGVPQFYEKLGGRVVNNQFYNGHKPDDKGNPFWDSVEMIYPATFLWPEGDIDLNGEGY